MDLVSFRAKDSANSKKSRPISAKPAATQPRHRAAYRISVPPLADVRVAASRQKLACDMVTKKALDFRAQRVVRDDEENISDSSVLVASPESLLVRSNDTMMLFDCDRSFDRLVFVDDADLEPQPAPTRPKKLKYSRAAKAKLSYRPPAPRTTTTGGVDMDMSAGDESHSEPPLRLGPFQAVKEEFFADAAISSDRLDMGSDLSDAETLGAAGWFSFLVPAPSYQGVDVSSFTMCKFDGPPPSQCTVHDSWYTCLGNLQRMVGTSYTLRCLCRLIDELCHHGDTAQCRAMLHYLVYETASSFESLVKGSKPNSPLL